MDRSRAARAPRAALAAGAIAYAVAVTAASRAPGPRAWALHLPGFLPQPERLFVMALLFGGALLLAIDFLRAAPRAPARPRGSGDPAGTGRGARPREPHRRARERAVRQQAGSGGLHLPRWTGWLLLLPWAWILLRWETRTHFLGDGTVWLAGIRSGSLDPFSEPLAAAAWAGFAGVLHALGLPINGVTAGLLPILCGIIAAALLWGIASEITPRTSWRAIVLAVLATLGLVQLYFGYIESYPIVSVAILAYLLLGLRRARDADHPLWLAVVLALTIAFHLATMFLALSYLYLLVRDKRPPLQRAALAILPFALAAGILVLLGYRPARWLGAFRIAARAIEPGSAALQKPYPLLSLDHAWDILNAVLLVLPVPVMLLLAGAAGRVWRRDRAFVGAAAAGGPATAAGPAAAGPTGAAASTNLRDDPGAIFLASAALPGFAMVIALGLQVAPAQDWDLMSILLLPLAVFGAKIGCAIPNAPLRGARGAALAMIGAGSLLSFVLVNAGVEPALHRYETIMGPGAKITAYGRAYGNEVLATYDVDRRDYARAVVHAQLAIDAEPTNPRYWIKKGAALYELGRYREATPMFQEGVRRGPGRDDGYYNLGNCLAREGRFEAAVANYREAVRLSPPRPDYLNNLAVALYYAGKTDSARALWTDVVRRWPEYTLSMNLLLRHFGQAAAESAEVTSGSR